MAETLDKLLNGKVLLQQPAQGYRVAIDPVLLAAAIPAQSGQNVLDLGCGAGAAMFCLAARVAGLNLTGIEQEPLYQECAAANIGHNSALGRFTLIRGDVLQPSADESRFDHAMMNPPYHDSAAYAAGNNAAKTGAHAMETDRLAQWVQGAYRRLKPRGSLTVIHKAEGLGLLLDAMQERFGAVRVFPLWPKSGQAAKRVIAQGLKDAKTPLQLMPGLVLHATDGRYSAEADAILREAAALSLGITGQRAA